MYAGNARVHQGTTQFAADLVPGNGGQQQLAPADAPVLRQGQQHRQYHHAHVADAGRMHVFAHQPVAHDAVDKSSVCILCCTRRGDDVGVTCLRCVTGVLCLYGGQGLAAPGFVARLESTAYEIVQTGVDLGRRRGINQVGRQIRELRSQTQRQGRSTGWGVMRRGWGVRHTADSKGTDIGVPLGSL